MQSSVNLWFPPYKLLTIQKYKRHKVINDWYINASNNFVNNSKAFVFMWSTFKFDIVIKFLNFWSIFWLKDIFKHIFYEFASNHVVVIKLLNFD